MVAFIANDTAPASHNSSFGQKCSVPVLISYCVEDWSKQVNKECLIILFAVSLNKQSVKPKLCFNTTY